LVPSLRNWSIKYPLAPIKELTTTVDRLKIVAALL
jgi:hypothetical protein